MNVITVIEDDLDGFRGDARLVQDQDGNHFVVVTIIRNRFVGGFETMAFRADHNGTVVDWSEIAGGEDMTMADVMEELEEMDTLENNLDTNTFDSEWYPEDDWEDWYREDDSLYEYENHI